MPRIYNATFQPFTYDELATPIREMTQAHQKVEEDYNNNMLVVDSLRQRAMNEPDAKWAKQITDYANQLEGYAMDLARNGLTRETRGNLLNMKRGYGTTVSPVLMAMQREKELQTVRDKAVGTNMVFGKTPTIDEIIANPNVDQSAYDSDDLYKKAANMAKSMSERNIQVFDPRNYNAYLYKYGKEKGFSNEDISIMLQNDPGFANLFSSIIDSSGYTKDGTLDSEQVNKLSNAIVAGALTGFSYDVDWKYGSRPDYMNPNERLNYEIKRRQLRDMDNPPVGSGSQVNEGRALLFTRTVDPKQQQKNDELRNKIINNKNIVTKITRDVNGEHYEISDNYVQNMLNALNGKIPSREVVGGAANMQSEVNRQKKLAQTFGINKDDTIDTAKKKVEDMIQNKATREDLSDATLHTSFYVPIDPSDYDKIRDRHSKDFSNTKPLTQDENGNWILSKDKDIDTKDYNPIRVEVGLNGIVQVWKNKENGEIVYTNFFDKDYGDQIYSNYMSESGPIGLNKAYNDRINFNANSIRNTFDVNMRTFDDNILQMATRSDSNPYGYTKGDLKNIIRKTSNYSKDNRNVVKFMNTIEQQYYSMEAQMCLQQLAQNENLSDQEKQDISKRYETALYRLKNAENEDRLLNNIIINQNQALEGIEDGILSVLAITKKTQPEQYGGGDYRKN